MDAGNMFVEYARAHVRMNSKNNARDWNAAEVLGSFLLLPPPEATFEQWTAALGSEGTREPAKAPATVETLPPEVALKEIIDAGICKIEIK